VYDDVNGWQTDQFLGQGEFYLNFGNYDVSLTVPHDHIVQGTGVIVNQAEVLTATQRARLAEAFTSETPKFIIGADEGDDARHPPRRQWAAYLALQGRECPGLRNGLLQGLCVGRGGVPVYADQKPIEMHSLYPRDAMPLWDKVSTKAIIQTMKSYGRMAFRTRIRRPRTSTARCSAWNTDDRLLRRASAARRQLHAAGGAGAHLGDDPRGGTQLVPHDRGVRRAEVDLDGRGPEQLHAVLR
jgi:hypothetical protein